MSSFSIKNIVTQEPAVISGAIVAVINALVLFGAVTATPDQIAGANVAMIAVLSLLVRQSVTPNAKL
ncbi:MAG: hypothetical protein JST64_02125 [Actinobacteria bacterium]|nr:hypothetical protein [Actinomycetota bacterium]